LRRTCPGRWCSGPCRSPLARAGAAVHRSSVPTTSASARLTVPPGSDGLGSTARRRAHAVN